MPDAGVAGSLMRDVSRHTRPMAESAVNISPEALPKGKRSYVGLMLACSALIICWLSAGMAQVAGVQVKPEVSSLWGLAGFWIPILAAVIIVFRRERGTVRKRVATRVVSIMICFGALWISKARTEDGWDGFMDRVRQDIRPQDLANWFTNVLATTRSPVVRRLSPEEMATFCEGELRHSRPSLWILGEERSASIMWGSDLQSWGIEYSEGAHRGREWRDNLYFRKVSK